MLSGVLSSCVILWFHSMLSLSGVILWSHSVEFDDSGELDELGELDESCAINCIDTIYATESDSRNIVTLIASMG